MPALAEGSWGCNGKAVKISGRQVLILHAHGACRLGAIDLRPGYSTALQLWPIGYRAECADAGAGCTLRCSIADGGEKGPLFRISLRHDAEGSSSTVRAGPLLC